MAESGTPRRPSESRGERLTVREVAVRLRVGDCTSRRRMRATSLLAKFFGGATGYRVRRAELRSFPRRWDGYPDSGLTTEWRCVRARSQGEESRNGSQATHHERTRLGRAGDR
jgi:hypothetical protein